MEKYIKTEFPDKQYYKILNDLILEGYKVVSISNVPDPETNKFTVRLERNGVGQVTYIPHEYTGNIADKEAFTKFIVDQLN